MPRSWQAAARPSLPPAPALRLLPLAFGALLADPRACRHTAAAAAAEGGGGGGSVPREWRPGPRSPPPVISLVFTHAYTQEPARGPSPSLPRQNTPHWGSSAEPSQRPPSVRPSLPPPARSSRAPGLGGGVAEENESRRNRCPLLPGPGRPPIPGREGAGLPSRAGREAVGGPGPGASAWAGGEPPSPRDDSWITQPASFLSLPLVSPVAR